MTDLQATLDAIDEVAVQECGHCRRPLRPDGPSPDFCGSWCQEAWLRAKQEIIDLVGYEEPDDLPVYVDNLQELRSPETTPAAPDWLPEGRWWDVELGTDTVGYRLEFDTTPLTAALERFAASVRRLWEPIPDEDRVFARLSSGWVSFPARQNGRSRRGFTAGPAIYDELGPIGVVINSLRVTAPEPEIVAVETGEPPFGSDFNFEHTAAKSLPHEPPPAAMPAVPEPDWQALVDAAPRTGPERGRRAHRELRRPR